jgi:thiamine-phosphate pyrophosphorylase
MSADLSIYLVTDTAQAAAAGHHLTDLVSAAVAGGVTAVQVREKQADAGVFLDTVLKVAAVLPASVALFVNDRVDVFLAARHAGVTVTGVHVGQQDLPVGAVRDLVGPEALIGLTANTPAELFAAGREVARVDYVGIGSVHATASKADAAPALGVPGFAALAGSTFLPAVAIGGITAADIPGLRAGGAAGVAVISVICSAADPRAATARLVRAWAAAT